MVAWAVGRSGGRADEPGDTHRAPDASGASSWSETTARPSGPILVLVNPQDIVNIASAVRIARNFGIERMRLVNPETFDPWRIEGIAHNSADFVAGIEIMDTLEAAVADCVHVAVLTARG
ncbi:MAG TPA: TrmH family RNA methyltransferase, partial [Gemmatimonadales bacterium]|nr:TrmH family RNA methyltransferase [Gemmatimonadales bacterium]